MNARAKRRSSYLHAYRVGIADVQLVLASLMRVDFRDEAQWRGWRDGYAWARRSGVRLPLR